MEPRSNRVLHNTHAFLISYYDIENYLFIPTLNNLQKCINRSPLRVVMAVVIGLHVVLALRQTHAHFARASVVLVQALPLVLDAGVFDLFEKIAHVLTVE